MDKLEAYSYLFFDELVAGLVFTSQLELVIDVMKIFATYNFYYIMIISIVANSSANFINIFLGRMIRNVRLTNYIILENSNYNLFHKFIINFTPIFLILFSIPLAGPLMALLIGLFKIEFKYMYILYIIIGKLIYYSFRLLYIS